MFSRLHQPRTDGYTLLEVMLSLTLFAVLSGGIFAIIQSTTQSVVVVKDLIRTENEANALTVVLRQACSRLPVTARVHSEKHPELLARKELQFRMAPGMLQWGERWQDPMEVTVELAALKQTNGRWKLAARKFNPLAKDPSRAQLMPWLPLIDGFTEIDWSFRDPDSGKWQEEWKDSIRRPSAVALLLRRPGETAGIRTVFNIPQVQTNALPQFGPPS